ncbi:MAG: sugar nucleotide-binding protein [Pirellulales bacterium]
MILLLGGTGYVGSAFAKLFDREAIPYRKVSRRQADYTRLPMLRTIIAETNPSFLINAAGYTGKPNVDACEFHKAECLFGNAVLPGVIRQACEETRTPWGHVSSGCIYSGSRPDGSGFREIDPPNFSFRTNNCSFYSGCKALGEECLDGAQNTYVWRLRIPFDHIDSPRNYLTKLMRYSRLLEATNSISHLDEFVWACWQTWQKRVPFGIYNVTNPGAVTTRGVVAHIQRELKLDRPFEFFSSEADFMRVAAKTPRSNCVMDSSKLAATGITLRPVDQAIIESLRAWLPAHELF